MYVTSSQYEWTGDFYVLVISSLLSLIHILENFTNHLTEYNDPNGEERGRTEISESVGNTIGRTIMSIN